MGASSLRIGVVALMLTSATALGMIGYQSLHPLQVSLPVQQAVLPPTTVGYIVAAHPLPAGTLARDDDFVVKSVPPADVPAAAIINASDARADLRGALIRNYIDAGQPIHTADVLRPRDRGFLASVLGAGMRAVSVGVDPVSGVAGLIWPGDHVDVILTQDLDRQPAGQRVLSETVLANVRVIAIDQQIVQGAPAGASEAGKLARTVTLEVTPEQANKVTVAEQLGHLALAIRAATDTPGHALVAKTTTFGADVSPALARTDRPLGQTVRVIEGNKTQDIEFR
jgi:pilus assembly protein CpaB